jgi:hypothetical protein
MKNIIKETIKEERVTACIYDARNSGVWLLYEYAAPLFIHNATSELHRMLLNYLRIADGYLSEDSEVFKFIQVASTYNMRIKRGL